MTSSRFENRPFAGETECTVVLPLGSDSPFGEIDTFTRLLEAEVAEMEAEFGCPVTLARGRVLDVAGPTVLIGPANANPAFAALGIRAADDPVIQQDMSRKLVVVDGPDVTGVGTAFQWLRTAFASRTPTYRDTSPVTAEEVLDRIDSEVRNTYPAFTLRGINWSDIVTSHRDDVLASDASLEALQRLFANLQDAHTWVKDATGGNARTPYRAWIDLERAYLTHVPSWSAAWAAGARQGDTLLDVDARRWWERAAATPRTRALATGMRWLAGSVGHSREFRVQSRHGEVRWNETYAPVPWNEPVSWRILSSGTGYLRIRGWLHTAEWVRTVDDALIAMENCPRLLVDLRGNVGGMLIAAQDFRDRFLAEETMLGTVQFSIGGGRLSAPAPIVGRPHPEAVAWHKPVRFLTDRQTYSASEDAILGLETLPHVEIVGEASGGGSGRPRTISLRDSLFATISTAFTFTTTGHCVEANGIPVTQNLPFEAHFRDPVGTPACHILQMADSDW